MPNACYETIMDKNVEQYILPVGMASRVPLPECYINIMNQYYIEYWITPGPPYNYAPIFYSGVPKLFGLLDTGALQVSGIQTLQTSPVLNLTGAGVLMGFLDTGIQYTNPAFVLPGNRSRIVSIWDQTEVATGGEFAPEGYFYGREYTKEQIEEALRSEAPEELVPETDENGHGTFIAGVAAGGELENGAFIGAAPNADIAVVKLRQAGASTRGFYRMYADTWVCQEDDFMLGIDYLYQLSQRRNQPLVLCISIGSNQGDHEGNLPSCKLLSYLSLLQERIIVAGAGNETGFSHHFSTTIQERRVESVEIQVGQEEPGFSLEVWAKAPEVYSVGFRSPNGEVVSPIYARSGLQQELRFVFDRTRILVNFVTIEEESGNFLLLIRFESPSAGIWNIELYPDYTLGGKVNLWLPQEGFVRPDTRFLRPDPDITLSAPANSIGIVTAAAYQYRDDSIYIHSSRGYTADGRIKPDIAAPGVDVSGPSTRMGNVLETRTGTSVAAALTAGAIAQLLQWGVVEGNIDFLRVSITIPIIIKGARREGGTVYPNRSFGWGMLDIYSSFRNFV